MSPGLRKIRDFVTLHKRCPTAEEMIAVAAGLSATVVVQKFAVYDQVSESFDYGHGDKLRAKIRSGRRSSEATARSLLETRPERDEDQCEHGDAASCGVALTTSATRVVVCRCQHPNNARHLDIPATHPDTVDVPAVLPRTITSAAPGAAHEAKRRLSTSNDRRLSWLVERKQRSVKHERMKKRRGGAGWWAWLKRRIRRRRRVGITV